LDYADLLEEMKRCSPLESMYRREKVHAVGELGGGSVQQGGWDNLGPCGGWGGVATQPERRPNRGIIAQGA
jgi:hypothetical protein